MDNHILTGESFVGFLNNHITLKIEDLKLIILNEL